MYYIKDHIDKISEEYKELDTIVDDMYDKKFRHTFDFIHELASEMNNKYHPVSDEVLEQILVDVPLRLFEISEDISSLELKVNVCKLKLKRPKESLDTTEVEDSIDTELYMCICNCLIDRVHSQVSYSRELIMGAKKIWDRRKQTEGTMPVSPIDPTESYRPDMN